MKTKTPEAIPLPRMHSTYAGATPTVCKIQGRFWMLQNDGVGPTKDAFGHATVSWPGRSIYSTKAEAVEAAKAIIDQEPSAVIYVMEAVARYETKKPPLQVTPWKK